MRSEAPAALPYHEPGIVTILIISSLLLCLNAVGFLLDKVLYCGLIGQILLGTAWGTPGAKWLATNVEEAIVQLGYLGLLLLVYEGGLSTSFQSLKANAWLSVAVAITGISVPCGLSFVLKQLSRATPIQCFAAGASLSSTSLGTTFTVLGTSGLTKSRIGVVLTSAAMFDDVVGLVLVQVISNFGQGNATITAPIVVRPLLVSIAFAVAAPLLCVFIVKPATIWLTGYRSRNTSALLSRAFKLEQTALSIHVLVLLGCVAGATYAGTSNLFAAYIAGAVISWWDAEVPHWDVHQTSTSQSTRSVVADAVPCGETEEPSVAQPANNSLSGSGVYDKFFLGQVDRILRPFFFASIGFSIPITKMFSGDIVWKGLVYAVLMCFAKLVCGSWLIRLSLCRLRTVKQTSLSYLKRIRSRMNHFSTCIIAKSQTGDPRVTHQEAGTTDSAVPSSDANRSPEDSPPSEVDAHEATQANDIDVQGDEVRASPATVKPRSIYPASIIGCAMVARGEIGFLISSIAEANGIFRSPSDTGATSNLFLIITWAIVICTIVGPLAVGLLVQRLKKLQKGVEKEGRVVAGDVLGVWGVS